MRKANGVIWVNRVSRVTNGVFTGCEAKFTAASRGLPEVSEVSAMNSNTDQTAPGFRTSFCEY